MTDVVLLAMVSVCAKQDHPFRGNLENNLLLHYERVMFLCQFLNHIGMESEFEPVLIFEDNQGAIALSKNVANHQRSKHIDIRYHFIRTQLNNGTIVLKYCRTAEMVADVMTKPPTKAKLEKFKTFLFG